MMMLLVTVMFVADSADGALEDQVVRDLDVRGVVPQVNPAALDPVDDVVLDGAADGREVEPVDGVAARARGVSAVMDDVPDVVRVDGGVVRGIADARSAAVVGVIADDALVRAIGADAARPVFTATGGPSQLEILDVDVRTGVPPGEEPGAPFDLRDVSNPGRLGAALRGSHALHVRACADIQCRSGADRGHTLGDRLERRRLRAGIGVRASR
jgi:hypothetical protein